MAFKKNVLLTGRPGVGKSHLIKKVVEGLKDRGFANIGGFYTLDIRSGNERIGFSINTVQGKSGRLAEVGFSSPFTLGRYGIDMRSFENLAIPCLEDAIKNSEIMVIDEIGWMELKSRRFRDLVLEAFQSPVPLIATIMKSKYDFTDALKARDDAVIIAVRVENRDRLAKEVIDMVTKK